MFSASTFLQRHTRWILLGLVFCMGVAMASPLVKPKSMTLVCTGTNAVALVLLEAEDDPAASLAMTLDCADCLPVVLPPLDISVRDIEKPVQGRIAVAKPLPPPEAHCLSPPSRGPPTPVSPT
ncbi:hypothetical protein [Rhodoferax sp.]|uniref:hypothetical protein n=1 Tax=Rhodoferax sp. TaxID=50421 RepID=UPI002730CDDD|nr:hypothetical protein [Rhodoferax sp.]MDP1530891.1 hypothetical protein [Rhodoferax sp.]MDP1942829.1 hypothetical protein [Rhodoferax sp.]MDP2440265.1 hypothetical protein [Rhodoferax sp.]MDP3191405.1 hypothetical protein [Rhodoferax sp.]MDP3337165.1 hypothetical protein [Rhodoferax sp.]